MGFKWKETLATVAPLVATSLGGPIAGVAAKTALEFLGIASSGEPEDDAKKLEQFVKTASPQDMLKLKQLDHHFKLEMRKADIDILQIQVDREENDRLDRDSAREREALVGGWTLPILTTTLMVGAFAVIYAIMFQQITASEMTLGTILGFIISEIRQMTAYYYGSSQGQDHQITVNELKSIKGNRK